MGFKIEQTEPLNFELFEIQNKIIILQSEAITELLVQLMLMGATEDELKATTDKVYEATRMRVEYDL